MGAKLLALLVVAAVAASAAAHGDHSGHDEPTAGPRGLSAPVPGQDGIIHVCDHSDLDPSEVRTMEVPAEARRRRLSSVQPDGYLRMHLDTTNFDARNAFSAEVATKLRDAANEALQKLEASLKTRYYMSGPVLYPSWMTQCFTGHPVPTEYLTTGVNFEDVYILLDAIPASNDDTIAYAGACLTFTDGKPAFGVFNYNPNSAYLPVADYDDLVAVATHEIIHVLGFAGNKFPQFTQHDGQPHPNGVLATIAGRGMPEDCDTTTDAHGALGCRSAIVTPEVIKRTREFFDCDTAEGFDVENQGGAGTLGSHWEARVGRTMLMAGYVRSTPILTPMTLALLESSGWYWADYSASKSSQNRAMYGFGEGCAFLDEKCLKDDGASSYDGDDADVPHFCTTNSPGKVCTRDRTRIATCPSFTCAGSDVPPHMQYYGSPGQVGCAYIPTNDYCPYPEPSTSCSDSGAAAPAGQTFGSDSMCFGANLEDGGTDLGGAGCFEYNCISADQLTITLTSSGVSKTVSCTGPGPVTVPTDLPGVTGSIVCPDPRDWCAEEFPAQCTDSLHYLADRDEIVSSVCNPALGDVCASPYVTLNGVDYFLRDSAVRGYTTPTADNAGCAAPST